MWLINSSGKVVKISFPVSVISTVCSYCADNFLKKINDVYYIKKVNIINVNYMSEKRESWKICLDCKERAIRKQVYCEKCRIRHMESNRARKQSLIENNLCTICGGVKEQTEKSKCNLCLEKMNKFMNDRRTNREKNGECIDCGTTSSTKRCDICYLKMISTNVFGTTKKYIELKELLDKQNSKCTYTGRVLQLQENCELDHIQPKSKGGLNSIENFQWLHRDVNKMKHDLTEKDFIDSLKEIMNHFVIKN